jgi:nitrate reductase delta subunit
MRALKALGWLLAYPETDWLAALPELQAAVAAEPRISSSARRQLGQLIAGLAGHDLLAAQERYVALFDRARSLSLHLFEHVHGESRERGQAMVDLLGLYGQAGLEAPKGELPDYLPMFLEYLSLLPEPAARDSLGDITHILDALHGRLGKRRSPYAAVFLALLDIAGARPSFDAAGEDDDTTLAALDRAWADQPVSFTAAGAPQTDGACGRAAAMVERFAPR